MFLSCDSHLETFRDDWKSGSIKRPVSTEIISVAEIPAGNYPFHFLSRVKPYHFATVKYKSWVVFLKQDIFKLLVTTQILMRHTLHRSRYILYKHCCFETSRALLEKVKRVEKFLKLYFSFIMKIFKMCDKICLPMQYRTIRNCFNGNDYDSTLSNCYLISRFCNDSIMINIWKYLFAVYQMAKTIRRW